MDVKDALLSVALLLACDSDMEAIVNCELEKVSDDFYVIEEKTKLVNQLDEQFPESKSQPKNERRGRKGYVKYCEQVVPYLRELLLTRFGAAARKRNSMVQLS